MALGPLRIPDLLEDQRRLLVKAWEVNAFLQAEKERYRQYYRRVRGMLKNPQATLVDIAEIVLEHGDVLDPDAPETR